MSFRVLRPTEIMERCGLRSSAMNAAVNEGLLPPLFKVLGGRASGCFEHELNEVLEARAAGAADDEIRAIVSRLVDRRKARLAELRVA
jgi:hypothetical protein